MASLTRLVGLGTAVPVRAVPQSEAGRAVERIVGWPTGSLAELFAQTKIERRHLALPDAAITDLIDGTTLSGSPYVPVPGGDADGPGTAQRMATFAAEAPKLAISVAQSALNDASVDAATVTHVVVVTCTGFAAPGLDVALIRELQLRPTVERVQVGVMGCHGAINGLRVAQGLVAHQPGACVLMVAVELCSLHFSYRPTRDGMVANALFADGAAALVVMGNAIGDAPRLLATGSYLFPNTAAAMSWSIGDHGFAMTLSAQLPKLIAAELRPWLQSWSGRGERDRGAEPDRLPARRCKRGHGQDALLGRDKVRPASCAAGVLAKSMRPQRTHARLATTPDYRCYQASTGPRHRLSAHPQLRLEPCNGVGSYRVGYRHR